MRYPAALTVLRGRTDLLLVAAGGAVGAASRYGVDAAVGAPTSTFLVNAVGCFLLGTVLYTAETGGVGERVRLVAAVGFLGSFTTYSTFAFELATAEPSFAVGYLAASYVAGFASVALSLYTIEVWQRG